MTQIYCKVSVVISTYSAERFKDVAYCIKSLRIQSLPPHEIILVLDPEDKLKDFYTKHLSNNVIIVVSEKYGLSNARNAGVRKSTGEIVAFIDDDAISDRDWLRNLVNNLSNERVIGVGGFVAPIWDTAPPMWFSEELGWIIGCSYKGLPEKKAFVRNPIGCNMCFKKAAFEKVGYFKSDIGRIGKRLLGGEETEFSIRLLQRFPELKILYDPSAIVYHKVSKARSSLKYFIRRSFYEGFSMALIKKNLPCRKDVVSFEKYYLSYLLRVSIPNKFKRVYKLEEFLKLFVLSLSIFSVLLGYLIGLWI